jgi:hypothetical protein
MRIDGANEIDERDGRGGSDVVADRRPQLPRFPQQRRRECEQGQERVVGVRHGIEQPVMPLVKPRILRVL